MYVHLAAKQAKRDLRRQVIYIRDADLALWTTMAQYAVSQGLPMSVVVAQALREYAPVRKYAASHDRAGNTTRVASAGESIPRNDR
jgi:hypothetical protein